jgi:GntR family transcriptional regulator
MNQSTRRRPSPPDLDSSAVPRYVQLASLFRGRIGSGTWPVGAQIPTVEQLVVECGVARATIRQALGQLEDEGLIERQRAKGTFVMRSPQEQLWCEVRTDWSGLLMSREGATIEVLQETRDARPPSIPAAIGELAPSYRHLRRRHSRSEQPFLLADIYVDEQVARKISKTAYETKTALKLIADAPGVEIADARQILTVGSADIEMAQQLQMHLNQPVVFVQRIAVAKGGRVVLIANGAYRGDIVHIDMRLK